MKKYLPSSLSLMAALVPMTMGGVAAAATLTYDADTAITGAQDGAGLGWNTTDTDFWDGAGNVAWSNTNADEAIFGSGSGTATGVTVGTVIANKITFNATGSGNYTLTGGTITLDGVAPAIVTAADATIGSGLAGTTGFTKSGAGTLTLSGANSYTGLTTVLGGAAYGSGLGVSLSLANTSGACVQGNVQLGNGTNVGAPSILKMGAVNQFGANTILDLRANGFPHQAALKMMGYDQTIAGLTSNTAAENVIENSESETTGYETGSVNSILTINTSGIYSYTGVIRDRWTNGSGIIGITKEGSGTQTLGGASIGYTGNTLVNSGTLKLVDATGYRSGTTTIASGAVLEWNDAANQISLNPSSAVSTIFNGAGTFRKTGAGIMRLGHGNLTVQINQPAGGQLDIQGGTLEFGFAHNAMGGNLGSMNVASGAKYYNSDAAVSVDALTGGGTIGNAFNQSLLTLTLGVSGTTDNVAYGVAGNTATFSGVIKDQETYNTVVTQSTAVVKTGSGTQVFSGANTYHGSTTINGGTLVVSGGAALADTGAVVLADAAGAQLKLGNSETIGSLAGGGATGGNVNLQGNTLTVGNASSTNFAGSLSGTGGLTKEGAGTLTLSGSNSYSGDTTVHAGVLSLATAFLGNSSTVTIAAGAKIDLATGTSDTVGSLVLDNVIVPAGTYNASHLTYGSFFTGNGSLVVAAGNPYDTWTAAKGLSGADALPDADPDKDGIANAVEFVLASEPNPANAGSNSSALLPAISGTASDLIFTFRRSDAANGMSGVAIVAEYGSTLAGWTPAVHGENGITITETNDGFATGVDKVEVSIPKALAVDSKLFTRLRVTLP